MTHRRGPRQLLVGIPVFFVLIAYQNSAIGQSTVFVDFSEFGGTPGSGSAPGWVTNLGTLTAKAGVAPLSASEITALESIILSELDRVFVDIGLDVTFTTTPGATTVIDFAQDTSSSAFLSGPSSSVLGVADFDWLNRQFFPPPRTFQLAEIFSENFDGIIDEWVGSTPDSRPGMIMELGIALGGTSAHELAHTYGARHSDAYGTPATGPATLFGSPPKEGLAMTMGLQNMHIMATGSTGISELERESMRTLSPHTIAKMVIASDPSVTTDSLAPSFFAFDHTEEVSTHTHATPGTAQDLTPDFQFLPIAEVMAANVHGASLGEGLSGGSLIDFYSMTLTSTSMVSAEVNSIDGVYASALETTLALLGASGSPPAIFDADDVDWSLTTMVFDPSTPIESPFSEADDPLLFNMILDPGTYYFVVAFDGDGITTVDLGTDLAFYDLFVTVRTIIPEPSLSLFGVVGFCLLLRWRNRPIRLDRRE